MDAVHRPEDYPPPPSPGLRRGAVPEQQGEGSPAPAQVPLDQSGLLTREAARVYEEVMGKRQREHDRAHPSKPNRFG